MLIVQRPQIEEVEVTETRSRFVVEPLDLAVVIGAAVLICFVATIYPSRQAARLDPAQALRYS